MSLCGTGEVHCCWFNGEVCQYLAPSQREGYVWDCSLRVTHGSWDAVYLSPEYQDNIKPKYTEIGRPDLDCNSYPQAGERCNDCGNIG